MLVLAKKTKRQVEREESKIEGIVRAHKKSLKQLKKLDFGELV